MNLRLDEWIPCMGRGEKVGLGIGRLAGKSWCGSCSMLDLFFLCVWNINLGCFFFEHGVSIYMRIIKIIIVYMLPSDYCSTYPQEVFCN